MAGLPDSVLAKMREKARAIKERQSASQFGPKAPRWEITGKNSIIQPGGTLIVRFLPRWDYAQSFMRGPDGKVVENPKYVWQFPWFEALEHWWHVNDGKGGERPNREWCLRTFDAECPVCDASSELIASADADERKHGKSIQARESFGLNAIVGGTGQRKMTESGVPDIRVMFIQDTILEQLALFISSEDAEFRRGDVTDRLTGYNLKLTRPKNQGERWKLDCSPKPSPLYDPSEAAVWKTWLTQLHNIPEVVKEETLTYDALYQKFHGVAPAQGSNNGATSDVTPESPEGADGPGGADEFSDEAPTAGDSPDLGFDLPPDPAEAPVPGKKPAAPQKAPVRR